VSPISQRSIWSKLTSYNPLPLKLVTDHNTTVMKQVHYTTVCINGIHSLHSCTPFQTIT